MRVSTIPMRGLLVVLFLVAAPAAAQELHNVSALVKPHIGDDAPGIAVLVTENGEILHLVGYGHADLDAGTKVTGDTLFDLASVSKQMTALALMLEIKEGRVALDTPVANVLPAFAGHRSGGRPLLISDLVHHVGGLPDYLDPDRFDYQAKTTNAEIIDWIARQPLDRTPGERFEYSNSGYVVLASVVAAVDGKSSLAEVLGNRVWNRLGMARTALVTPADPAALVTGYAGTGGDFYVSVEMTVTEGDGNVYTSIADLARYEAALAGNALLDLGTTTTLFSTGRLDNGKPIVEAGAGYGFGWSLEDWDGIRFATHSGSWYGTATAYLRNLATGVSVIVLSNGEDLDALGLAADIEEIVD